MLALSLWLVKPLYPSLATEGVRWQTDVNRDIVVESLLPQSSVDTGKQAVRALRVRVVASPENILKMVFLEANPAPD